MSTGSRINVAFYDDHKDSAAAAVDLTWAELVEALSSAPEPACSAPGTHSTLPTCPGKTCPAKFGQAWSPVEIAGERANANVRAVTAVVLDLDHISDETLNRIKEACVDYAHIIHSTHNHAPPADGCYRLVLPLSRPALPSEWPHVRRAVVEVLELPADPITKDLSRIYFLPTTRAGAPFYFFHTGGPPIDVEDALAASSPSPLPPAKEVMTPAKQVLEPSGPIDLSALRQILVDARVSKAHGNEHAKEQAEILGRALEGKPLADVGSRHGARVRLAGMLAYRLPANTPWESALELVRPCLAATPLAEGDTLEAAIEKTRRLYEEAMRSRIAWDEKKAAEQALVKGLVDKIKGKTPAAAAEELGDQWAEALIVNANGVKGCEHNAHLLLSCAPEIKGTLRWNEFTKRVEVTGGPLAAAEEDTLDAVVAGWLQRHYGFNGGAKLMRSALLRTARERPYDPIAEFLGELAWDGQPRIDTFLEKYLGADIADDEGALDPEKERYVRAVSRRWLISLVARALKPGCKVDNILVLEGAQGAGKSRSLEALVGQACFLDTSLTLGDKDTTMAIAGSWLVELGELASMRRAESEKVKQFISSKIDRYRPPYGASIVESPRRCVFVGTTNEEGYLRDRTGNRRYWPVRALAPDVEAIARDRDLILAESVAAYRAGERWWLEPEEALRAEAQAALRLDVSTTEEAIARWWYGEKPEKRPRRFTMLDAAEMALHVTPDRLDHGVRIEIGYAMRRLGFRYRLRRDGAVRGRCYEPTPELIEAPVQTSLARSATLALVQAVKAKGAQ